MVSKNKILLTVFISKITLQPVSSCFNLLYLLFLIHLYLLLNAAIAIAIDKSCTMGLLPPPYAGSKCVHIPGWKTPRSPILKTAPYA